MPVVEALAIGHKLPTAATNVELALNCVDPNIALVGVAVGERQAHKILALCPKLGMIWRRLAHHELSGWVVESWKELDGRVQPFRFTVIR